MVKLLENTFRAINIGLVNEVAIMCEKLGVTHGKSLMLLQQTFWIYEIYPVPPEDIVYQLIHIIVMEIKTRLRCSFHKLAGEINTSMPKHVVDLISSA